MREMWISKKKFQELEKKIADIERVTQSLQQWLTLKTCSVSASNKCLQDTMGEGKHKHTVPKHMPYVSEKMRAEKERVEHTMTLVLFIDDCTYFHLVISLDDIEIPDSVFLSMNKIPKFDMINEYCRAKYLLEHLQKTKQKALVIRTYKDFGKVKDAISKSQWSEVFRF